MKLQHKGIRGVNFSPQFVEVCFGSISNSRDSLLDNNTQGDNNIKKEQETTMTLVAYKN